MKKITVEIERVETIKLEIKVPDECTRITVLEKITVDPGKYLENHTDDIVKSRTKIQVRDLQIN